jgi:hypothetical protein
VQQKELDRIEELIDIKTETLETDVKNLKIELDLLKISLVSNDIILEKPKGLFDSKVSETNEEFITLCKFFNSKIFKFSLLYRATENNF